MKDHSADLAPFFDAVIDLSDPGARVRRGATYGAYARWVRAQGGPLRFVASKIELHRAFIARGVIKATYNTYTGASIREEWQS
jgi:hypothetical protein